MTVRIRDMFEPGRCWVSFEVFPPKTEQGFEKLYETVEELCSLKPAFISGTYGAGGSTRQQTLDMLAEIRRRHPVATTAHFTCVGSTLEDIRSWLARAAELGIDNIMALRGDPPKGETEFKAVAGGLAHANELVEFIRAEFPQFGIGVAGYPETHQDATSPEDDLRFLKQKVEAGGDAVFTQLFYDNDDFFRFRDRCEAIGIRVPIVPGLLPILSLQQIQRITSLCKARLPAPLIEQLKKEEGNPEGQVQVGIDQCSKQCEGLVAGGVPGIHFYVLNRADTVRQILNNVPKLLNNGA